MYHTTKGLILRETQYKDNDKLLSVLTEDLGLITAKARGVKRKNSKLRSGCQLLTYSEFTLFEKNGYYTVSEAEPLNLFNSLRQDIELLSLGSYFMQLLETVCAEGQNDPALLSLGLNSLYALDTLKKPQILVKAVFELRLMCLSGFAPILDGCGHCGTSSAQLFLLEDGMLLCDVCQKAAPGRISVRLSPGVLAAMQHISTCDKQRLFSFSLKPEAMKQLSEITERFLLTLLGQGFRSLDFNKKLFTVNI